MSRVDELLARGVRNDDGCLIWVGATGDGYAVAHIDGKTALVHRYVCAQVHGPVAPGDDVHHTCRVALCIEPAHLVAIPAPEHDGHAQRDKTHCPNGHEYDERNTYVRRNGWRGCRRCHRDRERARKARA